MNRKDFIYKASILAAGAAVSPLSVLGKNKDRLVILHTNDWHSHIEPFPSDHYKTPNQGGVAKRATLIESIRKEKLMIIGLDEKLIDDLLEDNYMQGLMKNELYQQCTST